MILSPSVLSTKVLIGNDAGYLLSFFAEADGRVKNKPGLEVGRDEYYSEIQATLSGGLEGGTYSFVIEGMTDEHYKKIASKKDGFPLPVIKLFLFWRDTNASFRGMLKNLAGLTDSLGQVKADEIKESLVAVLNIVKVSRKAGSRRYETIIEARERVYDKLDKKRISPPLSLASPLDAAKSLIEASKITVHSYTLAPGPNQAQENAGTDEQPIEKSQPVLETLKSLGEMMEQFSEKYGRGMYLLRDGEIHIGERKFPVAGKAKPLTLAGGLIETESLAPILTDPDFDPDNNPGKKPPERRQFKLTLKGRPDIKPGDVVRFDPPPELLEDTLGSAFGAIGNLIKGPLLPDIDNVSSNAASLYVHSVEHRLGRTSGFVTTVTGVELTITGNEIEDQKNVWDTHTKAHTKTPSEKATPSTAEGRAAEAVRKQVESTLGARRFPEVGEVRAMTTSGSNEPPGQTLSLFCGLAGGDGRKDQGRRLAIARPSPMPVNGAAYATPFAWGKCGLVLPRYPGTRVLVSYRNGYRNDPVEVGALWESGHGPDSQAGDWWLILPVGVPSDQRATIADDATPKEHTGKVSQDLIDADGNRVIEVGELTIRVGRDKLKNAGERPARGTADSVTIEHSAGEASITIDQNGKISIKGKSIELDAGSGDIKMNAANVKVTVSGSMDVS